MHHGGAREHGRRALSSDAADRGRTRHRHGGPDAVRARFLQKNPFLCARLYSAGAFDAVRHLAQTAADLDFVPLSRVRARSLRILPVQPHAARQYYHVCRQRRRIYHRIRGSGARQQFAGIGVRHFFSVFYRPHYSHTALYHVQFRHDGVPKEQTHRKEHGRTGREQKRTFARLR